MLTPHVTEIGRVGHEFVHAPRRFDSNMMARLHEVASSRGGALPEDTIHKINLDAGLVKTLGDKAIIELVSSPDADILNAA